MRTRLTIKPKGNTMTVFYVRWAGAQLEGKQIVETTCTKHFTTVFLAQEFKASLVALQELLGIKLGEIRIGELNIDVLESCPQIEVMGRLLIPAITPPKGIIPRSFDRFHQS